MELGSPEWVDTVASTNTAVLQRLAAGEDLPAGFVFAAREQTAGRGRGEHVWRSHPGRDLCCSVVMPPPADGHRLPSLALAVALAVAAALEELGVPAQTKWPNDVLARGGKIAGILPELANGRGGAAAVVVGIGLNVNTSRAEAATIEPAATSVLAESGQTAPVEQVLELLLQCLEPRLTSWEEAGFAALRSEWLARSVGLGQRVRVEDGATSRAGALVGFGDGGQLLLRDDRGATVEVWSGSLHLS